MPLMFSTCQQTEYFLYVSVSLSPSRLYIGSDVIFGFFSDVLLLSLWPFSTRAKKAWHSPEALSQSWAAGIWGSSLQFRSVLAAPFLLPPPLLILPFYSKPAPEYNTEEPCAGNRDTHP